MQYEVFDDMKQCTQERVESLLQLVPEFRRAYALKYKHVFGQFCALQSWYMIERMMHDARCTMHSSRCTVHYTPEGKPQFVDGPEFSISHCKEAIAVAVDEHPIGIDVESIRKVSSSLMEYTMNEQECALIRSSAEPDRAFIRLWTQKEAYLKYLGTGISNDMRDVLNGVDCSHFIIEDHSSYILSLYHE